MSTENSTTLEIIAPTVDEAVEKGLSQLGLPQDAVEVEVLDNGSKGLFGLGSRQARIRLTIKNTPEIKVKPEAVVQVATTVTTPAASDEQEAALRVSKAVVSDLLEKMRIKAQIVAKFIPPEDEHDEDAILIDIQGDDLSILIGRRSETLNALQYISSLIVNKQLGKLVPLVIDVQGYRTRRETQLRQMARRMAEQAVHTGKRQVLEPMPANERRLIHIELRNHPQVVTESMDEEPNRKVTIRLKK